MNINFPQLPEDYYIVYVNEKPATYSDPETKKKIKTLSLETFQVEPARKDPKKLDKQIKQGQFAIITPKDLENLTFEDLWLSPALFKMVNKEKLTEASIKINGIVVRANDDLGVHEFTNDQYKFFIDQTFN